MKKAEELRQEVDKLEETVRNAVQNFYNEIGMCDIDISVRMSFMENGLGERQLISTGVKVNVTV